MDHIQEGFYLFHIHWVKSESWLCEVIWHLTFLGRRGIKSPYLTGQSHLTQLLMRKFQQLVTRGRVSNYSSSLISIEWLSKC